MMLHASTPRGKIIPVTHTEPGRFLFLSADGFHNWDCGHSAPYYGLTSRRMRDNIGSSKGRFAIMSKKICVDCGGEFKPLHGNTTRCRSCWKRNNSHKQKVYSRQSNMKKKIVKKRGNFCANCGVSGRGEKLYLHHIVPVSEGGETTPDNLKVVCFDCHLHDEHGGRFQ